MDIKEDFLKIRPKITVNNWWKFVGSFNRNPEYSKNINYVTDIDIFNFTTSRKWSDALKIFENSNPQFIYLTCGVNYDFLIDINYDKPDYDLLEKKIKKLGEDKSINEKIYKSWMSYLNKKNKEGLVKLDYAFKEESYLRWTKDDIRNKTKIIGKTKYNIIDLFEDKKDPLKGRATFHFIWYYPEQSYVSLFQNFIPLDSTIVVVKDKQDAHDYFRNEREQETKFNTTYFYKRMFYYYMNKDWYRLFRELRIPCIDFKLTDILKEILYVSEQEFKLHKAILSKLNKLHTIANDPKYNEVDIDLFQGIDKMILSDAKKIGFETKSTDISIIYTEFKLWLNNKMPPFYNKWRQDIIKANKEIEVLLTPII